MNRRSFFKKNQDNQDKFRADLGQNEDNKMQKIRSQLRQSNICVEAENGVLQLQDPPLSAIFTRNLR